MSDDALELQDRLIRAMDPARKLRASQALRESAWRFKAAWIASRHPELSGVEVEERVREIFRD